MPGILYITDAADPLVAKVRDAASGRLEIETASAANIPSLSGFDALLVGDGPLGTLLSSLPADGPKLVQLTRGHHRDIDALALAADGITVAGASPVLAGHIARATLAMAVAAITGSAASTSNLDISAFDGKTVGIIGFGRVGQAVAKLLAPGDARVIYADVRTAAYGATAGTPIRRMTLDMLLSKADIATLHVQWGPTSNPLLGRRELGLLGSESILVNTADARLVDAEALSDVLKSGRIKGAALDTEEPEYSQFAGLPGVVATPYTAARGEEADTDVARFVIDNIEKALSGGEAEGVLEIIDYPRAGDPAFWSSRMAPRTV